MKTQSSSEKQPLQIDLAVFSPDLPEQVSQLLNNTQIRNFFSRSEWWPHGGKFNREKLSLMFPFMISASCSHLFLNHNKQEKIIMSISKTNFLQLKVLSLRSNKITSLEQLQFINMSLLEQLYLDLNNITKNSALNKCKWGNLKELVLHDNPIEQLEISRLQISDSEFKDKWYLGDQNRGHNLILASAKTNFNEIRLHQSNKGIKLSQRILKSLKDKKIDPSLNRQEEDLH